MITTAMVTFFCASLAVSFSTMMVLELRAFRIYRKHSNAMIDALFARDTRMFKKDWANGRYLGQYPASLLCEKYVLADKYRKRHVRRLTFFRDPWDIYPPDIQYITKLQLGINERWAERRIPDWKHAKGDLSFIQWLVWRHHHPSRQQASIAAF